VTELLCTWFCNTTDISLLGEFQTAITPWGQMLAQSRCVRGSTILGDGDAVPMLVAPSLVRQSMVKGGQGRPEHGRLA